MSELDKVYRLLVILHASEKTKVFDVRNISEQALGITKDERDHYANMLINEGSVSGIRVAEEVDGQIEPHIFWELSRPQLTMKGLQYLEDNSKVKKAAKWLLDTGGSIISQVVATFISGLMQKG